MQQIYSYCLSSSYNVDLFKFSMVSVSYQESRQFSDAYIRKTQDKKSKTEFIVFIQCFLHSSSKVVKRSIQESQISIMGETRPLFNSVHESIGSHIEIDKGW